MKAILKALLVFLFAGQAVTACAWGTTGHRVIAEIAEQHLTRKTKRNIAKIIGQQKLAYWSNWADFIKSDPSPEMQRTSPWHFVNTPADLSYDAFVDVLQESPENNLYKAYLALREEVKRKDAPLAEQQKQLYFILHLLADAHQPMHVGREEDKGGNLLAVTYFGRNTNIHRVWDSELIDGEKYSYTEYARVLDVRPDNYRQFTRTSLEEWLYETHQVANTIYADVAEHTTLSYGYMYKFKDTLESCLLKAGLRLAKELNELYG